MSDLFDEKCKVMKLNSPDSSFIVYSFEKCTFAT